jgi:maltooligosyltrehalose trehalohydrolase
MIFMGEEWAASTPWQFFASFPDPQLAEAVRTGRRREFARHGWGAADVPDPIDPATVERSRLCWSEATEPGHREMLALYRSLIAVRRSQPALSDPFVDHLEVRAEGSWLVLYRGTLRLACNLGADPVTVPLDGEAARTLLAWGAATASGGTATLPPETFALVELVS